MADAKDRTDIAVPLMRRNYYLNIVNGALSMVSMRIADAGTILPQLVLKLAGAEWAVGLAQAVQDLGRVATQVFAARWLDAVPRKMAIYIWGSVARIITLAVAAGALFWGVGKNPTITLAAFLGGLFVWMLLNGVTELAWMDITARSVPTTRRGSMTTGRKFFGMILALLISVPLVNYYLSDEGPMQFPANYGMLYVVGMVFFALAWIAFALMPEPPAHAARRTLSLRHHFARGMRVYRRDSMYRRLIRMRLLMGAVAAMPVFFIAFGKMSLGLADRWAALFLTLKLISEMISSVMFGRISDRFGNRKVIAVTAWASLFTFIVAALSAWLHVRSSGGDALSTASVVLLCAAFLGFGLWQSGREMGEYNYLLDIAPAAKRPSYIGFGNAFMLPLALLPILIGWVAPRVGYLPLFSFAAVVSGLAVVQSRRLPEPREVLLDGPQGAD